MAIGMILWVPDKTKPTIRVGLDIPPAVMVSVQAFLDTQKVPPGDGQEGPQPMYKGPGHLFLQHMAKFLDTIVEQHPTPEIAEAKATAATAVALAETRKAQLLDRAQPAEPK